MRFFPSDDPLVVVAVGHRAAYHQQENLVEPKRDPPRIARIVDDGKKIRKSPKTRLFIKNSEGKAHGGGSESDRHTESRKKQSVERR